MLIYGHRGNGPTSQGQKSTPIWQDYVTNRSGSSGKERVPKIPEQLINYPENSLPGFKRALESGADGIELDVYLSKDGVLMVTHDDALNKNVFGAKKDSMDLGYVSQKTCNEIKQYDIGFGEKIPKLDEVLDLVASHNTAYKARTGKDLTVIIELKGPNTEQAVHDAVTKRVQNGWKNEQFLCCSFKYDHLRKMRAIDKNIRLGPGIKSRFLFGDDGVDENYVVIKRDYQADAITNALKKLHDEIGFSALFPVNTDVKPELLKMAQQNGLQIICWTWNEKHPQENRHQLEQLARYDKEYPNTLCLMSDFPAVVREKLERVAMGKPINGGLH